MNKLKDYLQSIFGKSERNKPKVPFLHETFVPQEIIDFEEYNRWKNSFRANLLRKRLANAYFDFEKRNESVDLSFEFWKKPSSKGFTIFSRDDLVIEKSEFLFFQFDLFQRFYHENYRLNLADIQSQQKAEWIESVRRIYLKPSMFLRSGTKAHQLYGNLHLEYIERNDRPFMFRLLANSYRDQNFYQEKDFKELMTLITKE